MSHCPWCGVIAHEELFAYKQDEEQFPVTFSDDQAQLLLFVAGVSTFQEHIHIEGLDVDQKPGGK